KFDATGNSMSPGAFPFSGAVTTRGMAIDQAGNVYLTGSFNAAVTFGSGAGTTLTSAGGTDIFVAKFDNAGIFTWAKQFGSAGAEAANGIGGDGGGHLFLPGQMTSAGSFGAFSLTAFGGLDVLVARLNSSGSVAWAKAMGSNLNDIANSIAVDGTG